MTTCNFRARRTVPIHAQPQRAIARQKRADLDPSRDLDTWAISRSRRADPRNQATAIAAGVPEGTEVIDCGGKVVAPGLIDMRAFIGEPGEASRETLPPPARPQRLAAYYDRRSRTPITAIDDPAMSTS